MYYSRTLQTISKDKTKENAKTFPFACCPMRGQINGYLMGRADAYRQINRFTFACTH